MKTSNKLFVAVAGLVLGSLATYDAALRAEYRTGNYKDPLHNFNPLALRNFDEVAVPAASALHVKIVAGPFAVHVNKDAADFVRVTQQGQRLTVAANYPKEWKFMGDRDAVVISCPRLATLTTDGQYTAAGKPQVENANTRGEVTVEGFTQDSLTLWQDRASQVRLSGNTLGFLRATAGISPKSSSTLNVNGDNHIQAARLDIDNQSQLHLSAAIPQLTYHFSNNSMTTFSGPAAYGLSSRPAAK